MIKTLTFLCITLALFACSSKDKATQPETTTENFIQSSIGRSDEVFFVMDSTLWNSNIGERMRSICNMPYPISSETESSFSYHYTNHEYFRGSLKRNHNIVIPVLGNDSTETGLFYNQLLNQLPADTFSISTQQDPFYKNQQILYLYGKNEEILLALLDDYQVLMHMVNQAVRKRSPEFLKPQDKKISDSIKSLLNVKITLPYGFEIANQDSTSIWLRRNAQDNYLSILLHKTKYTETITNQQSLQLFEYLSKTIVQGSDSSDYKQIEQEIEPKHFDKMLNGYYCKETRGLWKMKRSIMGGPFISYCIVDSENNIMYYIEGFVFAPNKSKSYYLKEIQAILDSFSIVKE